MVMAWLTPLSHSPTTHQKEFKVFKLMIEAPQRSAKIVQPSHKDLLQLSPVRKFSGKMAYLFLKEK